MSQERVNHKYKDSLDVAFALRARLENSIVQIHARVSLCSGCTLKSAFCDYGPFIKDWIYLKGKFSAFRETVVSIFENAYSEHEKAEVAVLYADFKNHEFNSKYLLENYDHLNEELQLFWSQMIEIQTLLKKLGMEIKEIPYQMAA